MKILIVSYSDPHDGGDVTWNALRVAAFQADLGDEVNVFLLSDGVTLVHRDTPPPTGLPYDVGAELAAAFKAGVTVKTCGTCLKNRGLSPEGVRAGISVATLKDLSDWLHDADVVLTF